MPSGRRDAGYAGSITITKNNQGLTTPPPGAGHRAVYTTNTIEGLHRQIRKAIKTRGHFPDEQAATKLIYLAIIRADAKWQRNRTWTAPRAALKIHFGDRFPG
jgi:transposase-like protein